MTCPQVSYEAITMLGSERGNQMSLHVVALKLQRLQILTALVEMESALSFPKKSRGEHTNHWAKMGIHDRLLISYIFIL